MWHLTGAEHERIIGNTHEPRAAARAVVLIAHGFKGYKDYGMFPLLADGLAAIGLIAHRFNFSHSGMTERLETFERPDLFEGDTLTRQVHDLRTVAEAVEAGELSGTGLPQIWLGHSRGGITVLLAAGRTAAELGAPKPAAIVTIAAPARCNPFTPEQAQQVLRDGSIESPSSRTGQALRVGRAFLQEQIDNPAAHDLPALVAAIRCPILIIHGTADPTVDAADARVIADAAGPRAELMLIDGADHVLNTPNPADQPGEILARVIARVGEFVGEAIGKRQ